MKKQECLRKHVLTACRTLCILLLSTGPALSQTMPPANGAYHPAIFVTDNKENTYAYAVADAASSKEEIDGILKKRWNDMKAALSRRDVDGAVQQFMKHSRQRYSL